MKTRPLILLVGKSGSGKSTLANMLSETWGFKQLESYTTRLPRYYGETGHIFVSNKEFDQLQNIVAYTEYSGNRYCATEDQVDECDIYIIDPDGIDSLLEKYNKSNRRTIIIYLYITPEEAEARMKERGDDVAATIARTHNDSGDWGKQIINICKQHHCFQSMNVVCYAIDVTDFNKHQVFLTATDIIRDEYREIDTYL